MSTNAIYGTRGSRHVRFSHLSDTWMNLNKWNPRILIKWSPWTTVLFHCSHGDMDRALNQPASCAHYQIEFLSCPVSPWGATTVLLSPPGQLWEIIKGMEDSDGGRVYYSSISNRLQHSVSARTQETAGEVFAFYMSSNLLSTSCPCLLRPPKHRSTDVQIISKALWHTQQTHCCSALKFYNWKKACCLPTGDIY